MKNKRTSFLAAACFFCFLAIPTPVIVLAAKVLVDQTSAVTVEVLGINSVDRTLVLQGVNGKIVTIKAGGNWKNIEQIAVGDQLKAVFFESVTVALGEVKQLPEESAGFFAASSIGATEPGAVLVETVDFVTTIKAVDRDERILILELPDGEELATRVDDSIYSFYTLRKGDVVQARYVQAAAITVKKKG